MDFCYQMIEPNERGHYPIVPMGVELGLWQGTYQNQDQLWLRWWDLEGNLLLIGSERAELEKQRTEQEKQRAEAAEQRTEAAEQRTEAAERKAARLAERLRSLGIDPDAEGDI
jgi:hypothetical protein